MRAKRLARARTKFILRPGTTFSQRLAGKRNALRRWLTYHKLRPLFREADGVIAVSRGVADDIANITKIPRERIHVIGNPTVTPELPALSRAPVTHAWFNPVTVPVILGIGGLRRSKDFPTLVRAFAVVRRQHPARLMILGRGGRREALLKLARELHVDEDVQLPGFVSNPYAYLAKASVFVLSSLWEGSPNVLIEALAVGTPVVATDCPSGPRDILQGGRYGALVPPGDAGALAEAIMLTLRQPLPAVTLREAVGEHVMEHAARRYLEVFGLRAP
jgi:glycosyltransferase involved in cell wall biosynthesis